MVAPVVPAALHPLTPGNPVYAMLKVGALGAVVALRFVLVRRNKGEGDAAEPQPVEVAPARPHPVSKKKKKARKRRS